MTPSQMRKLWTMLAHFHGFVIEHLLNAFALEIPSAQAFYWRTAKGEQVDLLIRSGKRLLPFEVKLHSVPTRNDVGGLLACMTDLGLDAGYVLHRGTANYSLVDGIEAVSTTENSEQLFAAQKTLTATAARMLSAVSMALLQPCE